MKLTDKIRYLLKMPVYLDTVLLDGWTDRVKIYNVYCDKHKWFISHTSGHYEYFLCPKCLKETKHES